MMDAKRTLEAERSEFASLERAMAKFADAASGGIALAKMNGHSPAEKTLAEIEAMARQIAASFDRLANAPLPMCLARMNTEGRA